MPLIAEAFRFAGVRIETIERPESDLEAELRAGRRFDIAYRALKVRGARSGCWCFALSRLRRCTGC